MAFDIQEYVESKLDRARPSAGHEWTATCPACEKWGGFYINTETGAYVCFKCGDFRGKSIIGLVAQVEDITWSEATAYIFKRSVKLGRKMDLFTLRDRIMSLRPHESAHEPVDVEPLDVPLPKEMVRCYSDGKWSLPKYLKQRGFKSRTVRAWKLGWCRWGDYMNRLIIPIRGPFGRSFTARDMTGKYEPKYKNPTGADHRRVLIGWETARLTADLVLVEGPLDAMKFWQHGISALGLGGKELHDEQLALLVEAFPATTSVIVVLDPEEELAPYKVATRLTCHFQDIYLAKLPDGVDPGDSTPEQAMEALENAARFTGSRAALLRAKLKTSASSLASRYEKKKLA